MSETQKGFWGFAMEHPFLTFFAVDIIISGIVDIVRGKRDCCVKCQVKKCVKDLTNRDENKNDENK